MKRHQIEQKVNDMGKTIRSFMVLIVAMMVSKSYTAESTVTLGAPEEPFLDSIITVSGDTTYHYSVTVPYEIQIEGDDSLMRRFMIENAEDKIVLSYPRVYLDTLSVPHKAHLHVRSSRPITDSVTIRLEIDDTLPDDNDKYIVKNAQKRQTIWGLGYEIQTDAIGSGNNGLPDEVVAVPANLVPSERERFYTKMLKGFRYCRLAMGLYLRGLDEDSMHIVERYPNQMNDLKEMQDASGIEGFAPEYWSPAPYWKTNNQYTKGGHIRDTGSAFLDSFSNALVQDLQYLKDNGLKVVMWGLQNEPKYSTNYSSCVYTEREYYHAFKNAAPKIRQNFPEAIIHVSSWDGQRGKWGREIAEDPATRQYVDAWTWHRIGADSDDQINNRDKYRSNSWGLPVFNNEFEYLHGGASDLRFVNTAQSIMNWMVFVDSPTWFWLHALKPTYNSEADGYSLGFWRPDDDNDFSEFSHIEKGHWDFNRKNWHSLAGFLGYMPWNSVRIHVDEPAIRGDNRIMAFQTPSGKLCLVLTNRSGEPFRFCVDTEREITFSGFRYTPYVANQSLGELNGPLICPEIPDLSIEFWVEE
jgi:O-glycosyl hydrolase